MPGVQFAIEDGGDMTWTTSTDVHDLPAEAGEFLRARPVEHTVLLTEAAYLEHRPVSGDQLLGWCRGADGAVAGAFLRAPRHAPVLSEMPAEAVESLPDVLGEATAVDVASGLAQTVAAAWKRRLGRELVERSRITLHRMRVPPPAVEQPPGKSRVALPSDRLMLLEWVGEMMAGIPDDHSEPEYVVDDPIAFGGITLWEVDGEPVAMAGRSRLVAGMVRLSAVYALGGNDSHAGAAFAAACAAAGELADHVLTFTPAGKRVPGFTPVLDRVMLGLA